MTPLSPLWTRASTRGIIIFLTIRRDRLINLKTFSPPVVFSLRVSRPAKSRHYRSPPNRDFIRIIAKYVQKLRVKRVFSPSPLQNNPRPSKAWRSTITRPRCTGPPATVWPSTSCTCRKTEPPSIRCCCPRETFCSGSTRQYRRALRSTPVEGEFRAMCLSTFSNDRVNR